ncbi:hypothetical protein LZ198_11595 [Myxococcus sp. K15C18031901]|uniref:hypothetical protein n=1 Tax=Myxococcus dinghuensis TaxID=2906761 RepID=UPI0020A7BDBF|nr:hypothetical protein [Myxococcus dinghuensis]MCP3099513.1 hypothetical protein [Myxococcus dinghuensis]
MRARPLRPVATTPPRPATKLVFAPPVAREPVQSAEPSPPESTTPRPAPSTHALALHVGQEVAPVLEHAQRITHASLTVDTSARASTEAPPGAAVRNTFNVNVQLDPAATAGGMDRRTLEDALVDILRETARRHGLEV